MASLGTYRINEQDVVPSQSGNAIIALYNKPTSGKKIYINSVEIQNFRRDAIGTSAQIFTDYEVLKISAQTVGKEVTPFELDTDASAIPSQIKCFTGGNPTYSTVSITISTTGNLTFANNSFPTRDTCTRASGSWLNDGVVPGAIVTFSSTTSNNTSYVVYSVTGTVLTFESGKDAVAETAVGASTSCVLPASIGRYMMRHRLFAATNNAQFNYLNVGSKSTMLGNLVNYNSNYANSVEPITIAEGEGISFRLRNTMDLDLATYMKEFHTYILECTFSLDWGGGDRTYKVSEYITPNGEGSNLFSIFNGSGSGRIIKLLDISIGEAGDISTPYFMLVPFDYIEPLAAEEALRDVSYMKFDSTSPSLSSVITAKKDVVVFPKGFSSGNPLFALSFGSAVPANGLNYLITKDFLGPIYSAFFAEKSDLSMNSGTNAITNQLISLSHASSTIFSGTDLYLNPGEGIAIVAAAEPLSGIAAGSAQQVNKFAMGKYDYSMTFKVVEETVDLVLTGIQSGSEIRIFDHTSGLELDGIETSGTDFTYSYVYSGGLAVDIIIMHTDWQYYRINNFSLTSTGGTIPIQQITDRVYYNP